MWKKATIQKPRIYLVTGLYELRDVTAKTDSALSGEFEVGVSDSVITTTTGVPIGGTIGPFGDQSALEANITMEGPAIWAASFKRLDANFMKATTSLHVALSPMTLIRLEEDFTSSGHLRSSSDGVELTEQISWPFDLADTVKLLAANAATLEVHDVEELPADDEEARANYWKCFNVAEERINEGISNINADYLTRAS